MFVRYLFIVLFVSILYPSMLLAEASCASPTGSLTLNAIASGQNLDKPYVDGDLSSGESLYYKIDIVEDGTLDLKTAIDSNNIGDSVHTFGYFLDDSCTQIAEANQYDTNPRRVSTSVNVLAGKTYFFKISNHETTSDGVDGYERGYFQVENTFTKMIPAHEISIEKTAPSTVNSGEALTYVIDVINTGSEDTKTVQVVDTIPAEFTFIDSRNDSDWNCNQSGQTLTCDLNGVIGALGGHKSLYLDVKAKFFTIDTLTDNTATADVTYGDATTLSVSDNQVVTIYKAVPNITIDKSAVEKGTTTGVTNIVENTTFDYILKVTNNSANALMVDSNVWIRDNVPADFTVLSITPDVAAEWSCTGLQDFDCNLLVDLVKDASREIRVTVKAVGGAGSSVLNTADTEADTPLGSVTDTDTDIAIVDIDAVSYAVNFTKVNTDSPVPYGSETTYTFTVRNDSNVPLTNVRVLDVMPNEVTANSITQTGWTCQAIAANTIDCLISSLAVGETKTMTVKATANTIKNSVVNTATLSTDQIADKTATATIDIISDSQITMDKKAVREGTTTEITQIVKDNSFEYILKVTNSTSNALMVDSNVWIRDNVPADFTVLSITPDVAAEWSCTGLQDFDCNLLVDLVKDASREIRVKVKAVGTTGIGIDNTADAEADTPAGVKTATSTNIATVQIVDASYAANFTKTNPDSSVLIGNETTYTFVVTNSSNMPLTNVKVKDVMPSDLNVTAITQIGWTCQAITSNTVECNTTLAVGETKIIEAKAIAMTVKNAVLNTAILSSDQMPDQNATEMINIVDYPSNLIITKASSQDTILENDSFMYQISVINGGLGDEQNLTVTDEIPSDFTVDSNITCGAWNCSISGNSVSCNLASLAAGVVADDINITVNAPNSITVDKTVTNITKVLSDKEIVGVTATKDVHLVSLAHAIMIQLDSNPNTVYQGESFIYELLITNNSGRTTDSVEVSTLLPTDVVFDYVDSGGWSCDYNVTSNSLSCDTNGTMLLEGDKQINIHVFAPNYEVNVTGIVQVTTDLDPYVRDDNVSTVVKGKTALLSFTEQSPSKYFVFTDEEFTYGIKVKNDGVNVENDINATTVKVEIDLFATLYDVDINATGWNCSQSGTVVSCLLQTPLAPSIESPPITIGVKSNTQGLITTGLALTSDQSAQVNSSILVEANDVVDTNLKLEISDSVDPVKSNGAFSYHIQVDNEGVDSVKDAIVNLNTTSLAKFTLESVSAVGWTCTQTADLKQINCDLGLLGSGVSSSIVLNVRAPDLNTTLELNATLRSDYVIDSDLSDNSVSESTQVLKLDFNVDNLRDFTQVLINGKQNTNIYGEVFTIGNQSLCEQSALNVCKEPSYNSNDWIFQENVNLDASSPYDSSTSATLNLTVGDEVIWAGLYWMGMIDRNNGSDANMIADARYVYLKHDSETTYVKVESSLAKFNWKNDVSFGSNHFDYQGVADVTEYVKNHKGGDYWVAGVQTTEGYNISAGWSLVVVVEDNTHTRKLKNITLFDGYQAVWKNVAHVEANLYPDSVKASVSGFLTPNNGTVNSKLSLFGLEGDKSLDDSISITDENNVTQYLSNVLNPVDDVVNGTITDSGVVNHNRFPDLANTSGIDIDTFDVSTIIGNGQSSTDITIYSEGDRFFLGMFTFSTELYLPKICYVETMTNADYTPLTNNRQFSLGDSIGFNVSVQNDENETAENISLKTKVDVIYVETNTTMEVKNVGEGSFTSHTDLWDTYDVNATNDENETVPQTIFNTHIGTGADSVSGGAMSNGDSISIRYNGIIDGKSDSNETRNIYYISYKIDNMASIVETAIMPCHDLNQSIYVSEHDPLGFGITHEGGLIDGLDDNSSNESHLYTQLVGTGFNIDLVALEEHHETTRVHKGAVRLDLVDLNSTGGCNADNPSIAHFYVSFNDANRVTKEVSFPYAKQGVALRVQYPLDKHKNYATWIGLDVHSMTDLKSMLQASHGTTGYPCEVECNSNIVACQDCVYSPLSTYTQSSCSRDAFAIRPKSVSMDANSILVGGRDYNLTFDANASGYNPVYPTNNVALSIRRELVKPVTCTTIADMNESILTSSLTFVDGNATVTDFAYDNIGDINVLLLDTVWTMNDQNSTDAQMSDCVVGSNSNIKGTNSTQPDYGKYGCNITGKKSFDFIPSRFKNEVNLQNDDNNTFTYLDDTGTRRARAFMTISALLDDNTIASNYRSGCYAKDINYTFGPAIAIPTLQVYSDENTVQLGTNQFKTTEGNFSGGEAFPVLGINFARSKTTAVNPLDLNSSDLYIYLEDEDGVVGDDFENDVGVAKYYYARLYAPDYLSIESSNFRAGLFYEVYCDEGSGCDKGAFNLMGVNESRDHINWYIFNAMHSWKYGDYDVSSVVSAGDLSVNTNLTEFSVDLNLSSTSKRPYCDRISLKPDTWFAYDEHSPSQADKLSFKACFISTGSWAGTGEVGMSVDVNISKNKNTKIDW